MKMLLASVLVGAMMVLTTALPEAKPTAVEPLSTDVEEAVDDLATETDEDVPETSATVEDNEEDGNQTNAATPKGRHAVKRSTRSCPCGWSRCGNRCFRFFRSRRTWAQAQRYCQHLGGNLASVHSTYEERWLQRLAQRRLAWIGGSDAQQERYWFWIDGTRFNYSNWCRGEPNNLRVQHCARINWSGRKCWDDLSCSVRHEFICVRNR